MRIDFDKLELKNASDFVRAATDASDKLGAQENILLYDGEHFNRGRFWTGPQPATNDANNPASFVKVEKEFASKNGIKDVVDGHNDGAVSREIEWAFTVRRPLARKGEILNGRELTENEKPNEQEQALIREAQAALVPWWNDRRMLKVVQDATETLLKTSRSPLRIFVSLAAAERINTGTSLTLEQALNEIHVEACGYDKATVITDPYSMRRAGVYVAETSGERRAELTYLDDSGQTVVRVLRERTPGGTPYTPPSAYTSVFAGEPRGEDDPEPVRHRLNGKLLLHEMRRKVFVTPQMRQSNKQLNKAKTLRGHNLNTAGFAETNLLNVDLPGKLVTQPDGTEKFVPDPIQRGPSVVNSWTGIEYEDGQGNKRVASPSIERSEPSPVSVFLESERADYRDILEEGRQVHNLIAGDATATGVARIQARGNFALSLLPTKGEVDAAARWLLETVLALAADISGQAGRFDSLRVNADCRIDTGPLTPEEFNIYVMLWEKGIWSLERVQRATGIEDVDAENALIQAVKERLGATRPVQPPVDDRTQEGLPA